MELKFSKKLEQIIRHRKKAKFSLKPNELIKSLKGSMTNGQERESSSEWNYLVPFFFFFLLCMPRLVMDCIFPALGQ